MALAPEWGMGKFKEPVSIFMSSPVHSIVQDSSLRECEEALQELGVSSLAVIDASGGLVGVISNTDILGSGLRNAGNRPEASLLKSTGIVKDVMTEGVISVDVGCTMSKAAMTMVEHNVHRVFVTARGDIAGVISTWDIMAAVEAARISTPVSEFTTKDIFSVRASETIALATERLGKAHVSGLLVVDESEWPVGVFSQREALLAGDSPRSDTVESAMNAAVLTLPDHCALHNVARQARAMNVRRVAVTHGQKLVGIMTGVNFAKAMFD